MKEEKLATATVVQIKKFVIDKLNDCGYYVSWNGKENQMVYACLPYRDLTLAEVTNIFRSETRKLLAFYPSVHNEKCYQGVAVKIMTPANQAVKLDASFISLVEKPIHRVWSQIYPDAGNVSNREGIELCIDAGRMQIFTNSPKEREEAVVADKAIDEAIKYHGYKKVLDYLSKHISLGH